MLQPEILKGPFAHVCLKNGKKKPKGAERKSPHQLPCEEKREGQVHSSSCPNISRSSLHRAVHTFPGTHFRSNSGHLNDLCWVRGFWAWHLLVTKRIFTPSWWSLSLSVHGTEATRAGKVCIHHAEPSDGGEDEEGG